MTEPTCPISQAPERFAALERLYGLGCVQTFSQFDITIIGVGGVGSWIAEAAARTGVGGIRLIDADDVCVSNVNRQAPALEGNFGKAKINVMAERLRAINPDIRLETVESFLTPSNLSTLIPIERGEHPRIIIDACDAFRVKVELIAWCRRNKIPLIVLGSAGGRTDSTAVRVRDLSKTEHDALLSLIRRKLRTEFNFPSNPKRYFSIPAVYSEQNVVYPQADGSVSGVRPQTIDDSGAGNMDCGGGLGSAMHVTAAFAMAAVGKAVELMLKPKANWH